MNIIGSRIKTIRKINGLNQIEFASKIGVSQGTLSELEQDRYKPSTDTVIAISQCFNTDLNWLLNGTNELTKETNLFHNQLNEHEINLT